MESYVYRVVLTVISNSFINFTLTDYLFDCASQWNRGGLIEKKNKDIFVFDRNFCEYIRINYTEYFQRNTPLEEIRFSPAFGNLCIAKSSCSNCRSFPQQSCSALSQFLEKSLNQDLARLIMSMVDPYAD